MLFCIEVVILYSPYLLKEYNQHNLDEADVIVPIGGDGFLLKSLHDYKEYQKPFYGINYGSIGFLMNNESNEG